MTRFDPEAPLIISGVGGSGTRVVAEIARRLGVYIGADLNDANDNHWFTLLLKRPSLRNDEQAAETWRCLDLLTKVMTSRTPLTRRDLDLLARAVGDTRLHHPRKWLDQRARTLRRCRRPRPAGFSAWGWKEPNTHVFLDYLTVRFPKMKYIHVIRHGLDMAFSPNQNQLHTWHAFFDLPAPAAGADPAGALTYWCRANERAVRLARRLNLRFLLLNFDDLCREPGRTVPALARFIGGPGVREEQMAELIRLPRVPDSLGRYRNQDLSLFRKEDLATVEELGFSMA